MPYLLLLVNIQVSIDRRGWLRSAQSLQVADETAFSREFTKVP
jgi:hypothetical protein